MNKMFMYTVRDNLAHRIGAITCYSSDDEAQRALTVSLQQSKDQFMVRCAKDFSLVRIGEIDMSTGAILSDSMVLVCDLIEVLPHEV